MATNTGLKFFTWYFFDGMDPYAVTILADTKPNAIAKAIRCFAEKKIFKLEGPYTRGLETVLKTGIPIDTTDNGTHRERHRLSDLCLCCTRFRIKTPSLDLTGQMIS